MSNELKILAEFIENIEKGSNVQNEISQTIEKNDEKA